MSSPNRPENTARSWRDGASGPQSTVQDVPGSVAAEAPAVAPRVSKQPGYRSDIDGLRAIAILAVLAFHAFPHWVRGGFIGVDVFFVISGFLISTNIFTGILAGNFSFGDFYVRRIKRIFPPLIFILLATTAIGWFVLLATEYKQLGKHVAGGAGFISNFLLWREAGYFDNAAVTKPLLHLWSLSIEEQFYIAWPLTLWLACRKRRAFQTLLILGGVSFVFNVVMTYRDPVGAYFSPIPRVWELMTGALLALMAIEKRGGASERLTDSTSVMRSWSDRLRSFDVSGNAKSVLGALMILVGALIIRENDRFPGFWGLLPTVGTALIIVAGRDAWLNARLLASRAMVWFGLISYPLYLWHWPLLSFAHIVTRSVPSPAVRLGLALFSIVPAWISYRFVERPVRYGRFPNVKLALSVILMTATGAIGLWIYLRDGLPSRYMAATQVAKPRATPLQRQASVESRQPALPSLPAVAQPGNAKVSAPTPPAAATARDSSQIASPANTAEVKAASSSPFGEEAPDENTLAERLDPAINDISVRGWNLKGEGVTSCNNLMNDEAFFCAQTAEPRVAIIGDSHAGQLFQGFLHSNRRRFDRVMVIGAGSCQATLGVETRPGCDKALRLAIDQIDKTKSIEYVVIAGYNGAIDDSTTEKSHRYLAGFKSTVEALQQFNRKVIFMIDNPTFKEASSPELCAPKGLKTIKILSDAYPAFCNHTTTNDLAFRGEYDKFVEMLRKDVHDVFFYDSSPLFCNATRCRLYDGSKLLYGDNNHLSIYGSELVVRDLIKKLERAGF